MAENDLRLKLVIEGEVGDVKADLEALKAALERLTSKTANIPAIANLSKQIREGKVSLDSLDAATRQLVQDFERLRGAAKDSLDPSLFSKTKSQAEELGNALNKAAKGADQLKAAVAAVATGAGLGNVVKEAVEMESALTRVAKTTDLNQKQIGQLKLNLQGLAENLGISAKELASVAAVGGQLGVPAEKLTQFTELAAKMGIAFETSATEAANAIGTLQAALGAPIEDVARLADTINVLGNNMNAAERDIVEITTRIAGVGRAFGLSAEQTAALASAFKSLGLAPERAATAISALLSRMATASTQTAEFKNALAQVGFTSDSMAKAIRENAIGAITQLLTNLQKLPKEMQTIVATELFGREFQDEIQLVVSGLDQVQLALRLIGQTAGGEVNAEVSRFLNSTGGALRQLGAAFENLQTAIGDVFLSDIQRLATGTKDLATAVREFTQQNPEMVTAAKTIAELAAGAAGIAVLGNAFSFLASGAKEIGALVVALGRLKTALAGISGAAGFEIGQKLTQHFGSTSERIKQFGGVLAEVAAQGKEVFSALGQAIIQGTTEPLKALPERMQAVHQEMAQVRQSFADTAEAMKGLELGLDLSGLVTQLNQGQISLQGFQGALAQTQPNLQSLQAAFAALSTQTPTAAVQALAQAFLGLNPSVQQTQSVIQLLVQGLANGVISFQQFQTAITALGPSTQNLAFAAQTLNTTLAQSGTASTAAVQGMEFLNQKLTTTANQLQTAALAFPQLSNALTQLNQQLASGQISLSQYVTALSQMVQSSQTGGQALQQGANAVQTAATALQQGATATQQAATAMQQGANAAQQAAGAMQHGAQETQQVAVTASQASRAIVDLIRQYQEGAISAEQFAQASQRLAGAFKEQQAGLQGQSNVLQQLDAQMKSLAESFARGQISAQQFVQQSNQIVNTLGQQKIAVAQIEAEIAKLIESYRQGNISVTEFLQRLQQLEQAKRAAASVDMASAEQKNIAAMREGSKAAEDYAGSLQQLAQAKKAAAQAPPVSPEQGGRGESQAELRTEPKDEHTLKSVNDFVAGFGETPTRGIIDPAALATWNRLLAEGVPREVLENAAREYVRFANEAFARGSSPGPESTWYEQAAERWRRSQERSGASEKGGIGGVGVRFDPSSPQSYLEAERLAMTMMSRGALSL